MIAQLRHDPQWVPVAWADERERRSQTDSVKFVV
jgi:hypothetical protein